MRTLAFDGRMGAAGDMLLGALLAAGADRDALSVVRPHWISSCFSEVDRRGIAATRVDVLLTNAASDGDGLRITLTTVDSDISPRHEARGAGDVAHAHSPRAHPRRGPRLEANVR